MAAFSFFEPNRNSHRVGTVLYNKYIYYHIGDRDGRVSRGASVIDLHLHGLSRTGRAADTNPNYSDITSETVPLFKPYNSLFILYGDGRTSSGREGRKKKTTTAAATTTIKIYTHVRHSPSRRALSVRLRRFCSSARAARVKTHRGFGTPRA